MSAYRCAFLISGDSGRINVCAYINTSLLFPPLIIVQKVKNWVKELRRQLGADIVLAIVGNKVDLQSQVIVPAAEAQAYADSVGAQHFLTSAKENTGVEDVFYQLAHVMIEQADERRKAQAAGTGAGSLQRSNSRRGAGGVLRVEGADEPDDGLVNVGADGEAAASRSSRCCGGPTGSNSNNNLGGI